MRLPTRNLPSALLITAATPSLGCEYSAIVYRFVFSSYLFLSAKAKSGIEREIMSCDITGLFVLIYTYFAFNKRFFDTIDRHWPLYLYKYLFACFATVNYAISRSLFLPQYITCILIIKRFTVSMYCMYVLRKIERVQIKFPSLFYIQNWTTLVKLL